MKETQQLEIITENMPHRIGVIGASAGAGATFISQMLEREAEIRRKVIYAKNGSSPQTIIKDMGEGDDSESLDRVLIVVDCSEDLPAGLQTAIRALRLKENNCALIFNKCTEDFEIPQALDRIKTEIPCFRIPVIKTAQFTEMYNFTFYS